MKLLFQTFHFVAISLTVSFKIRSLKTKCVTNKLYIFIGKAVADVSVCHKAPKIELCGTLLSSVKFGCYQARSS